jgi:osmotically inducible protein OsmC
MKEERIMPIRNATAVWEGDLKSGAGKMAVGSGAFKGDYTYASRFEQGKGTNPEELIAAAHAGCFSMALSGMLQKQGYRPENIHTVARVRIETTGEGHAITNIELDMEGKVAGIEESIFLQLAEQAKKNCPVSRALSNVPISLTAKLVRSMAA